MTRNQLHGKKFEDLIKACGLFSGSADGGRTVIAKFDIEARFDKNLGLPTSIKSTGSDTVGLSDARRFWGMDDDFRMIVGRYEQHGTIKTFSVVHEILLSNDDLRELRGNISYKEVTDFHDGMSLNRFPAGHHDEARLWAQQQKKILESQHSSVILNPKIDSKSQRRLQCSIALPTLINISASQGRYTSHSEWIGDLKLPVQLNSSALEF